MSDAGKLLKGLNKEQGQAVTTLEGPLLVLAGAGTGKTRVITFRIAWMLANGIDPSKILALTFTNKAAREMKERIAELVSVEQAKKLTVGTFHSFCVRLLRKDIRRLNYLPTFTITDTQDQEALIKQATAQAGLSNKDDFSATAIASYIGDQKNRLADYRQAKKTADTPMEASFAYIYEHYQTLLEMQNMIDFDDMLLLTYELLTKHPDILKKYQDSYHYLLVDEYQDTNQAQFQIVKMLCGELCNLCVVGDDDQSIYGWRGADVDNILKFDSYHFPKAKKITLEQNYRSTNKILRAANAVIAGNTERHSKNLWSAQGDGENLLIVACEDGENEASFIADYILQEHDDKGFNFSDFAILYRSNHLSRLFEMALRKSGVPYRLVGGQEFFQRREIKDAAAYLKLLVNPREDQSFLRILGVPPRGMGDKAVNKLKELKSAAFLPFTELLDEEAFLKTLSTKARSEATALAECLKKFRKEFEEPGDLSFKVSQYLGEVGYLKCFQKLYKNYAEAEKRMENVDSFISSIREFEAKTDKPPTLMEYLESYALLEENDRTKEDESGNAVTLSTIHASKGLEYPYVFLPAMEHKIFPHERSVQEGQARSDEEMRLFYVALTRAQHHLMLSFAKERILRGAPTLQRPSPFLEKLPEDITEFHDDPSGLMRLASAAEFEAFFEQFNKK